MNWLDVFSSRRIRITAGCARKTERTKLDKLFKSVHDGKRLASGRSLWSVVVKKLIASHVEQDKCHGRLSRLRYQRVVQPLRLGGTWTSPRRLFADVLPWINRWAIANIYWKLTRSTRNESENPKWKMCAIDIYFSTWLCPSIFANSKR